MDLATALALAGRSMDVQANRLCSIAEELANKDVAAAGLGTEPRRSPECGGMGAGKARSRDVRHSDAANHEALRAARTVLSRTLEMLR